MASACSGPVRLRGSDPCVDKHSVELLWRVVFDHCQGDLRLHCACDGSGYSDHRVLERFGVRKVAEPARTVEHLPVCGDLLLEVGERLKLLGRELLGELFDAPTCGVERAEQELLNCADKLFQ